MGGWNGSGNVTLTYDWTDDRDAGTPITASRVEANEQDFISAIESTLNLDGETTMAASLPMGSNKLINLADGTALTDSVSFKQLQNSAGAYAAAGGSSNAYTLTLSPAPSAYAAGQVFAFKANHTNTGAATLNVNALGAKSIQKTDGATNLAADDLVSGAIYLVTYDGTVFHLLGEKFDDANVAFLNVAQEYTKAQNFNATTLTDAASIAWAAGDNQVASVTLGGNRTLADPSGLQDGATYILRVIQDGTGSRTLAYGSAYKWPSGVAPTLSTGAGAIDVLTFISDGTNMYGVAQLDFQ